MKHKRHKVMVWSVVGIVVAATAGAILFGVTSNPSAGSAFGFVPLTMAPAISSMDWSQGNKDAKVTVIEYGDFQCPACGIYYPAVKKAIASYNGQVLFVFRNFPLYRVHDDAGLAAQAAEAAGLQGKFWEMHDLLYEKQAVWSLLPFGLGVKQYFAGLASSLGLDVDKFNHDFDSKQVKDKIQSDIEGGQAAQVEHTPTFFINLKRIENPAPNDFKSVIDKAFAN